MMPELEIIVLASVVAMSCSLLGTFLVLKRMAMMSDAITHTILLGIVIAFFITHDFSSPLLIVGAALMGVITVYLIEALQRTKLLSEESSIGVVFPFIFSIAIILITKYAGSVHLDTDAVLLGEISFAPFDRTMFMGISIPKSLLTMVIIFGIDLLFVGIFFKELKLTSFDAILATTLGFSPLLVHYALMTLISVTAVGAFNAVGSVLVIAFMIGPPITASLLTHDLKKMIGIGLILSVFNAVVGYYVAVNFDVSIAGCMAVVTGITFMITFLFAPHTGYISTRIRRQQQRKDFQEVTVLFHLMNHQDDKQEQIEESHVDTIHKHLNLAKSKMNMIIQNLQAKGWIRIEDDIILLTPQGIQVSEAYEASIFES